MVTEIKNDNILQCFNDGHSILKIEKVGLNTFHFINNDVDMEVVVDIIDDYKTRITANYYKYKTKSGHYRNSKKLWNHNSNWALYMLENYGFIRKY